MRVLCITDVTMPGGVDTYIQQMLLTAKMQKDIEIYLMLGKQLGSNNLYHIGYELLGEKCVRRDIESSCGTEVIIRNIEDMLQQITPDIVHVICGSPRSALAIREYISYRNIPLFFTESLIDSKWEFSNEVTERIISLYKEAQKVFTVSLNNAEIIRNVFHWPAHNIVSVPNGANVASIKARSKKGHVSKFITVARLERQKGIDVLIEAIRLMPRQYLEKSSFTIMGEGIERAEYERMIELYGLSGHVSLPGWNKSINEELKNYDCFVLPSRFEGMPIALIEAMAAKLYCIGSSVSGIPEVLENGKYGMLFDSENAQDLCDCICCCIEHPDMCERIAQEGYEHILKKHDCFKNMELIINHWKSA